MKTARLPLPAITSAHVRALAVTTVVVLTLAVATSMASAVASSVPIVNPSMESGWTAAGPAGWQMGVVGAGSATVTSSSSAHSGAYSARTAPASAMISVGVR